MPRGKTAKTRQVFLRLEGDVIVLLDALVALVKKQEREKYKAPVTQSEVAGAVITAYMLRHAEDILESITDAAEQAIVAEALRPPRARTGLPRPHRAGGDRADRVSFVRAAAAARDGRAAAPVDVPDR